MAIRRWIDRLNDQQHEGKWGGRYDNPKYTQQDLQEFLREVILPEIKKVESIVARWADLTGGRE